MGPRTAPRDHRGRRDHRAAETVSVRRGGSLFTSPDATGIGTASQLSREHRDEFDVEKHIPRVGLVCERYAREISSRGEITIIARFEVQRDVFRKQVR